MVTDHKKTVAGLQWAVFEMMKRYKIFFENDVKDLAGYNAMVQSAEESACWVAQMTVPHVCIWTSPPSALVRMSSWA